LPSIAHAWGRFRGRAGSAAVALAFVMTILSAASPAVILGASLSLDTPYPAVEAAAGGKVSLTLNVRTDAARRVDLAVTSVPKGWGASLHGGGFLIGSVTADPKAPPDIKLEVKIPDDAATGTYRIVVRATSSGLSSSLPVDIRIAEATGGGLSFTTDFPQLQGPSSTTFTFNLTLNNDSPADVTYTLNATGPDGWQVSAKPASQSQAASATVTAGSTSAVTVTATPPSSAAAGSYPIAVQAMANGQPVNQALAVEITGEFKLDLSTPDQRLSTHGVAGSATQQQFVVQNTGSAPLTGVKLTATPPTNWKVTFDQPSVDIAANDKATVTATIVPSGDAVAGDYVISVTATAEQANQSQDLRFTVETSTTWAIIGIGLIVITLGALGWVFRRFGRR